MRARVREVEPIALNIIHVGDRLRSITDAGVETIAESMAAVGLLSPIEVRIVETMVIDGEEVDGVPVLVAGATRLAAAKKLGWETIDTLVVEVSPEDARRREIAENLHRNELTRLERDEHIAEWIRLTAEQRAADKPAQVAPVSAGGRGREGGINAACRELGVERTEAQRAVKIASISEQAKQAAVEAHIDNNQSALLKVAAAPQERQADVVREIAEARALKVQQDVQNRAANEIAEIIVANLDHDAIEAVRVNLAVTTSKAITAALANLLGESIMDRRHG